MWFSNRISHFITTELYLLVVQVPPPKDFWSAEVLWSKDYASSCILRRKGLTMWVVITNFLCSIISETSPFLDATKPKACLLTGSPTQRTTPTCTATVYTGPGQICVAEKISWFKPVGFHIFSSCELDFTGSLLIWETALSRTCTAHFYWYKKNTIRVFAKSGRETIKQIRIISKKQIHNNNIIFFLNKATMRGRIIWILARKYRSIFFFQKSNELCAY